MSKSIGYQKVKLKKILIWYDRILELIPFYCNTLFFSLDIFENYRVAKWEAIRTKTQFYRRCFQDFISPQIEEKLHVWSSNISSEITLLQCTGESFYEPMLTQPAGHFPSGIFLYMHAYCLYVIMYLQYYIFQRGNPRLYDTPRHASLNKR